MYQQASSRMRPRQKGSSGCLNPRVLTALGMAAFALISYFGSATYNPVTGETQYINISVDQERHEFFQD